MIHLKELPSFSRPIATAHRSWRKYRNVYLRICTYTRVPNRELVSRCLDQIESNSIILSECLLSYLIGQGDRGRSCHLKYVYRDLANFTGNIALNRPNLGFIPVIAEKKIITWNQFQNNRNISFYQTQNENYVSKVKDGAVHCWNLNYATHAHSSVYINWF